MSRYRYRPVTVSLPFLGLRYRPLPFSDQRYPKLLNVTSTLPTVTDLYRSLPNFTVTCVTSVTSVTDRNIVCFEQIFKVLFKKMNVTLITLVTQVTVKFGYDR